MDLHKSATIYYGPIWDSLTLKPWTCISLLPLWADSGGAKTETMYLHKSTVIYY